MSAPYKETYFQTPDAIESSIRPGDENSHEWQEDPSARDPLTGTYERPGTKIILRNGLTTKDVKEAYAAAAKAFRTKLKLPLNADKEQTEEALGGLPFAGTLEAQRAALDARDAYLKDLLKTRRLAREALQGQQFAQGQGSEDSAAA